MLRNERLLLLIALFCFAGIGLALLSQHVFDLPPCAWCVLQRLIYLAIGVVALIGACAGGIAARLAAALSAVLAVCGGLAAWYQFDVAAKLMSCDMTFADRFMTGSGLNAAVPWLLGIYASCMDSSVAILGVDYAIWSLLLFGLLFLLAAARLFRRGGRIRIPAQRIPY